MTFDKETVTTQRTAKVLKAQIALSMFLMIFGGFSLFLPYDGALDDTDGLSWPIAMMLIGAVWYVGTKVAIWWQHE